MVLSHSLITYVYCMWHMLGTGCINMFTNHLRGTGCMTRIISLVMTKMKILKMKTWTDYYYPVASYYALMLENKLYLKVNLPKAVK